MLTSRDTSIDFDDLGREKVILEGDIDTLSLDTSYFAEPRAASTRRCTDISFIIAIVICWIIMTLIGVQVTGVVELHDKGSMLFLPRGNPQRLFRGLDYQGNLCGLDSDVEKLKIKWEPNADGENSKSATGKETPVGLGICVAECPSKGASVSDPYDLYGAWVSTEDTINVLGYCQSPSRRPRVLKLISIVADILRTMGIAAVVGFLLASLLSLLFLLTIRIPCMLRIIIWTCIFLVFTLALAGGNVVDAQAASERNAKDKSSSIAEWEISALEVTAKLLYTFAVLWACLILFMRERVAIAVTLVKEASTAILEMPLLMLLPLLQTLAMAAFTAIWLTYAAYLVSSAEMKTVRDPLTGLSYKEFNWSDKAEQGIIFLFFCWAWTAAFVQALGSITFAHSIFTWFYIPEMGDDAPSNIVISSLWVVLRYHSGSAAFGSLIIALFSMLRASVEYVQVKFKLAAAQRGNWLMSLLSCLLSCCLCCFDSFLKFVNKQAFIQIAASGEAFLPSARKSFVLIVRNIGRLAVVTVVGDFVVWVGKVSITASCAGLAYLYIVKFESSNVSGFVFPVVFASWVSYLTASLFLSLISAASNTMLQAYIMEEELARRNSDNIPTLALTCQPNNSRSFEIDAVRSPIQSV